MRSRSLVLASLSALVVAGVTVPAAAQDLTSLSPGATAPPDRNELSAGRPYWGAGKDRWFGAATFDSAGISARIGLDVGYGKPHHQWFGLQVEPQVSFSGIGAFGGLRAATPFGSLRVGPRFYTSLGQHLVEKADVITKPMLDLEEGPRSRYLSLDAELNVSIPLPLGSFGALLNASGVFGVNEDYYVFENSLRVVMEAPFVGRLRLNYLAPIGAYKTFRIGGMVEGIYNPGREYLNIRTGPAVAVSLTHHLEALAQVAFSVYNPDEIGLAGADLGQIGLRYRWASGDLWPEFP